MALRFAEAGLKVLGFDIDAAKVQQLNAGGSYIERLTPASIQKALGQGLEATVDFSRTVDVDVRLIICVLTTTHCVPRTRDLSFIVNTIEAAVTRDRCRPACQPESTQWPGTTDEVLAPRLRAWPVR